MQKHSKQYNQNEEEITHCDHLNGFRVAEKKNKRKADLIKTDKRNMQKIPLREIGTIYFLFNLYTFYNKS